MKLQVVPRLDNDIEVCDSKLQVVPRLDNDFEVWDSNGKIKAFQA